VQAYTVESIVNNTLKLQKIPSLSNGMNEPGAVSIMPYAQPDLVRRFIKESIRSIPARCSIC